MIFGKLPDEIFRPLAGKNRFVFETVLKQLHAVFGDDENPESDALSRQVILEEIKHVLLMEDQGISLDDEDEGVTYDSPGQAAEYIYGRLLSCGWIEKEEDGYNIAIIPNPNASILLDALIGIEHLEKASYGLTVLSIYNHLDTVCKDPKERGLLFAEAVSRTREFTTHLRNITYSLKEVQEKLATTREPRELLKNFFDDFVENILIADYKTLNSADNPFRFRSRILDTLRAIEYSKDIYPELVTQYQTQQNIDHAEASFRFRRDLRYIRKVFESVDRRLAKIDTFRFRLEKRVGETVKILGRSMPGISNRILDLMQQISVLSDNDLNDAPCLAPAKLLQISGISRFSTKTPRGRKEQPAPQVLKPKIQNPEAAARRKAIREYMKKRKFNPQKVSDYLSQQIKEQTAIEGKDLTVSTVDELLCFLQISQYSRYSRKNPAAKPTFLVRNKGTTLMTDWGSCPDFIIERNSNAH